MVLPHDHTLNQRNAGLLLPTGCITAFAVAAAIALTQPAFAERVRSPRVPANLQVPAGNKAFLDGRAIGTQSYICLPSASGGFTWVFFGPQATLFNDDRRQIVTHFLSPNPFEADTPRATWQHSRDTSAIWGSAMESSADPKYVRQGAIPWLLLQVVGGQDGPTRGDRLTAATYIQRLNTVGGIAPATGCAVSTDVGKRAFVPYKADYVFYKYARSDWDDD
jgi:hypothetical protein